MLHDINRNATTGKADPANARGSTVQVCLEDQKPLAYKDRAQQYALLYTLKLIELLQFGPLTPRILRHRLGLDAEALSHHIIEAKHLGADLEKKVLAGNVFWQINNWPDCQKMTLRWIELETARDLREKA